MCFVDFGDFGRFYSNFILYLRVIAELVTDFSFYYRKDEI